MRKLSKLLFLFTSAIMLLQVFIPTISLAFLIDDDYTNSSNVYLNIQTNRTYNERDDEYQFTDANNVDQNVFKIGEYNNENNSLNFSNLYYCLKWGIGFGSSDPNYGIPQNGEKYVYAGNLKDDEFIDNHIPFVESFNCNAVRWLVDNMYIPNSENSNIQKVKLLNGAGITDVSFLTDNDIDVTQQFVLWSFIEDDKGLYNILNDDNFALGTAMLKINEKMFSDSNNDDFTEERAEAIDDLYFYLKTSAQNNTVLNNEPKLTLNNYAVIEGTQQEAVIIETTIQNNDVILIGPFSITQEEENENKNYDFSYEFRTKTYKDETNWSNPQFTCYEILDSDYNYVGSMEDMINKGGFYLALDHREFTNVEACKLDINYTYYKTKATVWIGENDVNNSILTSQPVLKVEKEKESPSKSVVVEKEEVPEKYFDLSLRKFISSTESGSIQTELNNRSPKIYLNTLKNGTYNRDGELEHTATYEHTKEPILLKRGDKIIYTIRVYNEGDIDGYAKEVTDYLSSELELVANSTINDFYGWEQDEQNPQKIKTNYLQNILIKAYDENLNEIEASRIHQQWQQAEDGEDGLCYSDLQIECRIKEGADINAKIPNVAEISEDKAVQIVDGNEVEVIIDDRDSYPNSLTEEQIRNYGEGSRWYNDDDDYELVIIQPFDLALRKYITTITRGQNELLVFESREPQVTTNSLFAGTTTAEYKHRKDPIEVQTNDIITYNITIYNEGDQAGRATKIIDQLPTGLELVEDSITGKYLLESYDRVANRVVLIEKNTNENLDAKDLEDDRKILNSTEIELKCKVVATVTNKNQVLTNIAWIAEEYNAVTNETFATAQIGLDRDSAPGAAPSKTANELNTEGIGYTGKNTFLNESELSNSEVYYQGQQDDDDFEKVIVKGKYFDLALRKYIGSIERNGENVAIDSREPNVDLANLINGVENVEKGKTEYTATYAHDKNPITVKQGDIITYKIRVYNEGDLDGYATEITDYLPAGLGFLNGYSKNANWKIESTNVNSMPLYGEDGWYKNRAVANTSILAEEAAEITIVTAKENEKLELTDSLSLRDKKLNKFNGNELSYEEIEVTCIIVAEPNTSEDILVNYAEISGKKAVQVVDGNEVEISIPDRDSTPKNINLDDYELREENSMYQQDDDDYEPVRLTYFDLALRKFINKVNNNELTGENSREQIFIKLDENGNPVYGPEKDTPVNVVDNDIITYKIRVFNEGTIAGYAEEIEDDIPKGLVFLPENEVNTIYKWKMYYRDENNLLVETDDATKATVIRTDYLSEANGELDAQTGENSNIIKAFDKTTMTSPAYKDVQVAFKVLQVEIPEENTDRIITNKAHITKDSDDDEDSTPDEWIKKDDDQDWEKVYVQEFDLALYKWVSETKVTVDGKTTVTETGFKPNVGKTESSEELYGENFKENYRENSEPEPIAQVTIGKKKLNSTVVKFVYNIKVVNEGDVPGYATEITDYIPAGLEFIAEDNEPLWKIGEKDGTVTTNALDGVVLNPGEYKTVTLILTWINDSENFGQKTNIAAITEDNNDKNIPDIDSTPGNEDLTEYKEEQEDDDDFAIVYLVVKSGKVISYIGLILGFVVIIAVGAITIKKYVL